LLAIVDVQDRAEVALGGRVSEVGDMVHTSPVGMISVNVTCPEKLLTPATEMVAVPVDPALMDVGETGPAETVKSTILKIM
jgi:hypothetical protein